ncbi:MAG: hypothetical protein IKU73_02465 [Clostridia bacterium]|nr:hypothetical protein [Clostridia bacterium]
MGGCLTRIALLLGVAALLFVGAHVLGFVKTNPVTGAPELSFEQIDLSKIDLGKIQQGLENLDLSGLEGMKNSVSDGISEGISNVTALAGGANLPAWAYGVSREGMTVKTLRAGEGEAVLVCCDGYTMLVGGGSGMGISLAGQLLLCGVNHLNAVVAPTNETAQIYGLPLAMTLMQPDYLLYQDCQTKNTAVNRMLETAQKNGKTQLIAPQQGLTFSLGRATVTVIGPAHRVHTDERDDSLSLRVDYGATSVLIMCGATANGERELITSNASLRADALICARGGSVEATSSEFAARVAPKIALMTGKEPANSVKVTLQRIGAAVYTAADHGVMTLVSDGQTMAFKE